MFIFQTPFSLIVIKFIHLFALVISSIRSSCLKYGLGKLAVIQQRMVKDGKLALAAIDLKANDILEVSQHFCGFIPKWGIIKVPYIELWLNLPGSIGSMPREKRPARRDHPVECQLLNKLLRCHRTDQKAWCMPARWADRYWGCAFIRQTKKNKSRLKQLNSLRMLILRKTRLVGGFVK